MPNTSHQLPSNESKITIVIGAGMVGISTALHLQRLGCNVTLIDKSNSEGRASFGNSGVLCSSAIVPVTQPKLLPKIPRMLLSKDEPLFLRWSYLAKLLPWAFRYLSHANERDVRRIAAALTPVIGNSLNDHLQLAQGTAAERHIQPCDFAVLFKNRAAFEKDRLPWDVRRANGFNWSELEGKQRTKFDPLFSPDYDFMAVFAQHGQITDPGAYLSDLTKHFVSSGGTVVREEVTDIIHTNGIVEGVKTNAATFPAHSVAITAGAWSPLLTKKLGIRIPLEAESGYHLEFWGANKMPNSPTLVPSGKFILSPMEGRLRIAGTVEFGGLNNSGSEPPKELLEKGLQQLIPDLKFDSQTHWVGHRPAPTDSIPIIDQIPTVKGVYIGCGHQHVGLTGSARTGQLLANMICNKPIDIDMSVYRINRFGFRYSKSSAMNRSSDNQFGAF